MTLDDINKAYIESYGEFNMNEKTAYNSLAEAEFLDELQKLCKRFRVEVKVFTRMDQDDEPHRLSFIGRGINVLITTELLKRK